MANKRIKERKWFPESDPSFSLPGEFADDTEIDDLDAESDAHRAGPDGAGRFDDLLGEGPSMEEILASLEGLLDAGSEAVLQSPPVRMDPLLAKTDHAFAITSLKGFENDANLEQEILASLNLQAYGDEDFSEEGETPVDLSDFKFTPVASAERSEQAVSADDPVPEDVPVPALADIPENAPDLDWEVAEPEAEAVAWPEPEPETEAIALPEAVVLPEPEPETEPGAEGIVLSEPVLSEPVLSEPVLSEPVLSEPVLAMAPEMRSEWTAPRLDRESAQPLTADMLRENYGERVERIVGAMAQQILREILPGLLEKAIREELERIKNSGWG